MEKGTTIKFKGSKVLREIVSINESSVTMDNLDEKGIRKILTSNNFNHRKTVSREYFDKQVENKKIIKVV